jgi:transposase
VSLSQASVVLSGEDLRVLGVLLPCLGEVEAEGGVVFGDLVRVQVRARAGGAACPQCKAWCTSVHDRYRRTLADAGIGGRRLLIRLQVRLLRCGNAGCPVKRFAEQPAGLASPYARRTPELAGQLTGVAVMLAGRAGSRLARAVLAAEVSRDVLIRLVMAVPDPPAGLVRVLGVDDFSLRRGHSYATILVDMETGLPVDVLPDREAGTLEAWLREHPGVQIICRDRAGAYADAARTAAPGAVQVADRWHLWHNLCEHARKAVTRHRDCPAAGRCRHDEQEQEQEQREQEQADPETVIRERHAAVHALRARGQTLQQAAAALSLGVQVTSRFWNAADPGALLAVRGAAAIGPYLPYLHSRWDQGITKIAVLHREITARGFTGTYTTTWAWLTQLKLAAPPKPPPPPTPRQITRWLLTDPAHLNDQDAAALAAARARCPELDTLARHVAAFAKILTRRAGKDKLGTWITAVTASPGQPELRSFITGIRQDYDAVCNAMTLSWNSGLVEGRNTRTKLIKRQMYGRASFTLLRKLILISANTNTLTIPKYAPEPRSDGFLCHSPRPGLSG